MTARILRIALALVPLLAACSKWPEPDESAGSMDGSAAGLLDATLIEDPDGNITVVAPEKLQLTPAGEELTSSPTAALLEQAQTQHAITDEELAAAVVYFAFLYDAELNGVMRQSFFILQRQLEAKLQALALKYPTFVETTTSSASAPSTSALTLITAALGPSYSCSTPCSVSNTMDWTSKALSAAKALSKRVVTSDTGKLLLKVADGAESELSLVDHGLKTFVDYVSAADARAIALDVAGTALTIAEIAEAGTFAPLVFGLGVVVSWMQSHDEAAAATMQFESCKNWHLDQNCCGGSTCNDGNVCVACPTEQCVTQTARCIECGSVTRLVADPSDGSACCNAATADICDSSQCFASCGAPKCWGTAPSGVCCDADTGLFCEAGGATPECMTCNGTRLCAASGARCEICGDGTCGPEESPSTCAKDCAAMCGDVQLEAGQECCERFGNISNGLYAVNPGAIAANDTFTPCPKGYCRTCYEQVLAMLNAITPGDLGNELAAQSQLFCTADCSNISSLGSSAPAMGGAAADAGTSSHEPSASGSNDGSRASSVSAP